MADSDRDRIPYGDGWLPAYRFPIPGAKRTVVVFGGFDSYIEELFPVMDRLNARGWEVIGFEGPGQGGALEEAGLPFEVEWEHPVAAVLDYYRLEGVCLLGISLGGGLAIRAGAFEPRIKQVVCDDVLADFLEVSLMQLPPLRRRALGALMKIGADDVIDALARRAMRHSPLLDWGLHQGMHVFGVRNPAAFLEMAARFQTASYSPRVAGDCLLLAGAEDHYVPLTQFQQQFATLTGARSVTGHVLTRVDSAQDHCHVGNIDLSMALISDWLDQMVELDRARSEAAQRR